MARTKYIEPVSGPQGIALTAREVKNNFIDNSINDGAITAFTAFAIIGVEYTINSAMSLAAEYNFGFTFGSEPDMVVKETSGTETSISGGKYSSFGLSSVGVLTLAIYLD